jgi:hypothetical protein
MASTPEPDDVHGEASLRRKQRGLGGYGRVCRGSPGPTGYGQGADCPASCRGEIPAPAGHSSGPPSVTPGASRRAARGPRLPPPRPQSRGSGGALWMGRRIAVPIQALGSGLGSLPLTTRAPQPSARGRHRCCSPSVLRSHSWPGRPCCWAPLEWQSGGPASAGAGPAS